MVFRGVVSLAAVGVVLGCAPPPSDTRLVLLDEAARRAGAAVVLREWEGAPAFPVRLLPEERPTLLRGEEAGPLQVPAGTLAYVRGPLGQVELMDLEVEVNRDALRVLASGAGARALGELLDATVEELGGREYQLAAPDLLENAAFIELPRGVREVLPVRRDGRRGLAAGMEAPRVRGELPLLAGMGASADPLELAGLYRGETASLLLDAEGGFSLFRDCWQVTTGVMERPADGRGVVLSPDRGRRMELVLTPEGLLLPETGELLKPLAAEVEP